MTVIKALWKKRGEERTSFGTKRGKMDWYASIRTAREECLHGEAREN